jgi:signal transduction histidine kinase
MSEPSQFAELISRVAHELRSPLTSIKGFSATLVKRWDRFSNDQRFQFVKTIHYDSQRMSRIVTEVLDLARLEASRIEFQSGLFRVKELIRQAVASLDSFEDTERVEIEASDDLSVWADGERLARGIANLVENALKFSNDGAVRVLAERSGSDVAISVSDEGVGIEPERLPTVFSGPGPPGQAATPSGSGFGLYLTRRLLEAQGGSISVTSALDKGSTFTITLPSREPGA